eukprot:TRINITY_DN16951_c0_g1_i1.p1 TRINITY_DN16951_c0_g1~~TRINITY_DN16951_c0_g1_i1.p1  ORF type:complete len:113 (-),score=12.91 TRINITY_DN16951_c0_g1_i1:138-476(-)
MYSCGVFLFSIPIFILKLFKLIVILKHIDLGLPRRSGRRGSLRLLCWLFCLSGHFSSCLKLFTHFSANPKVFLENFSDISNYSHSMTATIRFLVSTQINCSDRLPVFPSLLG